MITIKKSKSREAEAYRTLRTNIQFSSLDKKIKSIVMTSSEPSDGKSTVILNLAVTMSQIGKKVVIVDCDLRKPVLHKRLGVSNYKGITNILVQDFKVEDCIKETGIENLYALTCGIVPPNPAELLSSDKMKKLLDELENKCDIVLIDSPPVLAVTDAQILANIVDGVLFVVSYGKTEKKDIVKAKELLGNVGAKILGVVLNKTPSKKNSYYYYSEESGKKVKKRRKGNKEIK